ncbi:MAG: galactokinase [Treponema sp.]|nr:galactokinase [Treponema sp.]
MNNGLSNKEISAISFLEKINSEYGAKILTELYGKNEIDSARQRYTDLITEMKDCFPETELNASEKFRIFTAPGRTELGGNHTDHNRGKVLAASIHLDTVAVVQKRNDNIVFLRSKGFPDTKIKLTNSNGEPDLKPKPEEKETTGSLVRGIASELNRRGITAGGFSANITSTVLPGSGLSSSASIEVLVGRIFDSLYGNGKLSALEIAQIGQTAENVFFGKPCGLMDQTACATGGTVVIDFEDEAHPVVKQVDFDLAAADFALCVVNTGGSHADLTADYASIPSEMKAVAAFFGKSVLREVGKEKFFSNIIDVRKAVGDRAFLRSLHYFDENDRVDAMLCDLKNLKQAVSRSEKWEAISSYFDWVDRSGDSSWKLLQNIYSTNNLKEQGIALALALTKDFLFYETAIGACRVHGGGFAGTIQVYIPLSEVERYRSFMEAVFGEGSVTQLQIRQTGAVELFF